jgi:hypothetical protein
MPCAVILGGAKDPKAQLTCKIEILRRPAASGAPKNDLPYRFDMASTLVHVPELRVWC